MRSEPLPVISRVIGPIYTANELHLQLVGTHLVSCECLPHTSPTKTWSKEVIACSPLLGWCSTRHPKHHVVSMSSIWQALRSSRAISSSSSCQITNLWLAERCWILPFRNGDGRKMFLKFWYRDEHCWNFHFEESNVFPTKSQLASSEWFSWRYDRFVSFETLLYEEIIVSPSDLLKRLPGYLIKPPARLIRGSSHLIHIYHLQFTDQIEGTLRRFGRWKPPNHLRKWPLGNNENHGISSHRNSASPTHLARWTPHIRKTNTFDKRK